MSQNTQTASGGPGLATLLTVLFVGLKLTGYISWSWWWVISPMLIAFGLGLFIGLVVVAIALLKEL